MNMQVMIYEVKTSANKNFDDLYSPDSKYYYWNDKFFKKLKKGDNVFVVNSHANKVLFTQLEEFNITTTIDNGSTLFEDLGTKYKVSGIFKKFVRLRLLKQFETPDDWSYRSLGSSEITYLNGSNINLQKKTNRLANILSLKEVCKGDELDNLLGICETNFSSTSLYPQIVEALNSEYIQDSLSKKEFRFQKGFDKLVEFDEYSILAKDEINKLLTDFNNSGKTYTNFIKKLDESSQEYTLFKLIGQLVSYCDRHAANKNELNEYDDKRTIAMSGVRQTEWVQKLLDYKAFNNDINRLSPSIKNAIEYLKDSNSGINMLSENHREMFSFNLLKQSKYNRETFVEDLVLFFKPYNVDLINESNRTEIYSDVLYRFTEVKKLWFERINGLVVCDNTGWLEEAIRDVSNNNSIVLWWDKKPTGGKKTVQLLKENFNNEKAPFFYIYYTTNQFANYRSRIIDLAFEKDYKDNNWNEDNNVARYSESFEDYRETKDGKNKSAKILFLADSIEKIETPIHTDDFRFYKNYYPPTQNNMQPFVDLETKKNNTSDMEINLNTILYGPPGTGKTYNTINYALDVLNVDYTDMSRDEIVELFKSKVEEGRIVFTTFHQSMSYEDFIEGIKPKTKSGKVVYEIKPGIFKNFCSTKKYFKLNDSFGSRGQYRIIGLSNEIIKIERASGMLDLSLEFINEMVESYLKGDIDDSFFENDNRKELRKALPSSWDKYLLGYNSMFREMMKYVSQRLDSGISFNDTHSKVFIIDEINRGNIANIFGELITLIEYDKRIGKTNYVPVTLPYSGELFGVPDNLYIIGTMNTADRSVEALDTALRRRFSFIEMDPQPTKLNDEKFKCKDIELDKMLAAINSRIEKLLDKDYCIGHSYFMEIEDKKNPLDELRHLFNNKILPLMQEYFYGDWGKIMLVLGSSFVEVEDKTVKFLEENQYDDYEEYEEKPIYRFTKPSKWSLDSFKSIYE